MDGIRTLFSLANEETARLKWFEAFMRGRCGASCCVHRIIPTKSIIRVELEQQTYADSNVVHEPATNCPERISGLRALLDGAPPLLDSELLWHRALEKLLDGTRDGLKHPWQLRSEAKINGRTVRSDRRAGKVGSSYASRGNLDRQRGE